MTPQRSRIYRAVNLGHLTIDIFNSMGPVLLTFLSVSLLLSNRQIGFAVGLYQLLAGGTQPLFGWLTDRVGSRWLGPGSVGWTVACVALSLFAAERLVSYTLFLILFSLAAVGSGAFHPQGTMHAARAWTGRAATATAVFFFCGQWGLASGPLVAGFLLDVTGPPGIYWLTVLALPVVVFMTYAMRSAGPESPPQPEGHRSPREPRQAASAGETRWLAVAVLAAVAGLRGWAFMGTAFFLPKLFQDLGWSATAYGAITGIFWLGSGITGIASGRLADRLGRRKMVFWSTFIGSLTVFWLPLSGGGGAFLLAIVSGGLLGASHSIQIVMAQDLLPYRPGLASGVALGYLFGVGAVAGWAIGILADHWGLAFILQGGAVMGILSVVLTPLLPSTRGTETPVPTLVVRSGRLEGEA